MRSLEGRDELHDLGKLDSVVDLAELLEETGQDDRVKGLDVLGHLGVLGDGGEDGLDLCADGERVELDLEDVVELTQSGRAS